MNVHALGSGSALLLSTPIWFDAVNAADHEQKQWLEISIQINPVAREPLSAFLFDLGCTGIVSENFDDRTLKAYFPLTGDPENIHGRIHVFLENLKKDFPEIQCFHVTVDKIGEQDWSQGWRRFFHTEQVTPKLVIVPVWEPIPPDTNSHIIRMDPGLAFGTGRHPTTRMCLKAMEKIQLDESWSMLDLGTGSGILAIYGAQLGAGRILALEIDEQALQWAKRNLEINRVSDRIDLSSKPVQDMEGAFSLLTANLILGEIIKLLYHMHRLLIPGGWLILSGLLSEQVEEIRARMREFQFVEKYVLYQEEWACVIVKKERAEGAGRRDAASGIIPGSRFHVPNC